MSTTNESVESRLNLRAALWAGVIGSLVFQVLEIVLIPLFGGGSPWGPARMIAAIVLGQGVLSPAGTFSLPVVVTALVVDIVLAMIYAAVLAAIVRRWSLGAAAVAGAVFGVVLYAINFYGFTVLFPWFVIGRNGVTIFTHVVFSLTVALVYKRGQRIASPPAGAAMA